LTNRIDIKFEMLANAGRIALVPFITVGYPDIDTSEKLSSVLLESGADILELGIPFSDPLAEGKTIQKTSFHAIQQGVTIFRSLELLKKLRVRNSNEPIIFMGYLNPFLNYGLDKFSIDAATAGLDGVIVPDLPAEESGTFAKLLEKNGLYLIPLIAPTSSDRRIEQACANAGGFIYCVSLTGVTGARTELKSEVEDFVERVRNYTDLPLVVGFGVSTGEHIKTLSKFADGAVVGSALLDAIGTAPQGYAVDSAQKFINSLTTYL
jgi:tryptophan synthase alpha chain